MANKTQWKTIYKRIMTPTELWDDDGGSMIISGTYSREKALDLIRKEIVATYKDDRGLERLSQLKVALLRRPDPNNDWEDMECVYYAEVVNKDIPDEEHYCWFYSYEW